MNLPLVKLRQQYPTADRFYGQPPALSVDEIAGLAPDLHLVDDRIQYLDDIRRENYGRALRISEVLREIPPEAVVDDIGEDVAAWLSIGSVIQGHNDAINEVLKNRFGYDIDALNTARLWYWRRLGSRPTKHALAEYGLMQSMRSGALDTVDLPALLHENAVKDVELSDARIDDYELKALETNFEDERLIGTPINFNTRPSENLWYDVYLDAPTGFMLTYKDVPQAMAAVAMETPTELMIHQLQGVNPKRIDTTLPRGKQVLGNISARGLAPLDWRKLMVDISERIARQNNATSLGIQAGENNTWRSPGSDGSDPHMTREDGERSYDAPAQRLGFAKSPDDSRGNWHRDIAEA